MFENNPVVLELFVLGKRYLRNGRLNESAKFFELAAQLEPTNVYIANALAIVHIRNHDLTLAAPHINRAVEINKNMAGHIDAFAWKMLGGIVTDRQAVDFLSDMITNAPVTVVGS